MMWTVRLGDETYVLWRGQVIYKIWHATKTQKRASKVIWKGAQP